MEGFYQCRKVVRENGSAEELRHYLYKEDIKPELLGSLLKDVITSRQDDYHEFMKALIKY